MYNRINEKIVKEIVNLYNSGWSENRIAKHFGYSRHCIRKRLLDSGVHIRNQSEAETIKWGQMSIEQRKKQVKAAHNSTRGKKISWSTKCKHAKTIEKIPSNFSATELILHDMLLERGIHTIHQKAIGTYNCDLAANPVAVEVWGGHWHFYGRQVIFQQKRICYLLNRGWFVYILPITKSFPLTNPVADYLTSYIKRIRRDKPIICEYRVVWGAGDYTISGSLDCLNFPLIPPFCNSRNLSTGRYERITR